MKLIITAVALLVIAGCAKNLPPEEIARKAEECRRLDLLPVQLINIENKVADVTCRIPKEKE